MDTTIFQVPLKKSLRDEAVKSAKEAGFSSLQEVVRVFLTNFSDKRIQVSFGQPPVELSAKARRRYDKMIADVKSKKTKPKRFTASDSIEQIMAWLNS